MENEKKDNILQFRCHFSIILEKTWQMIVAVLVVLVANVGNQLNSIDNLKEVVLKNILPILGVSLVIIIVPTLFHFFRWRKTTISLDDTMLVINRDTINKQVNTIALVNISNINMEQNIFEMLMGTYKIKLDTNSLSTANSTDVEIILKKNKAVEFKNLLMQYIKVAKQKQLGKDAEVTENASDSMAAIEQDESFYMDEMSESDYDICATTGDIFRHCLYSVKIVTILMLIGVVVAVMIGLKNVSVGNTLLDMAKEFAGGFISMVIIAIGAIQSMIKDFFKLFNYRAKRTENRIFLSYGALKKQKFAISVEKINAIIIKQPVLSRIFGRCQVDVVNVGTGEENGELSQLIINCKIDECAEYIKKLLPEFYDDFSSQIQTQKKKVAAYKMIGVTIWNAILLAGTGIFLHNYNFEGKAQMLNSIIWIGMIVFALFLYLCSIVKYKTEGIAVLDRYMVISYGSFQKNIAMIPYGKIQYMEINENPVGRLMKLKTCSLHILAALAYMNYETGYFSDEQLEKIHKKVSVSKSYI